MPNFPLSFSFVFLIKKVFFFFLKKVLEFFVKKVLLPLCIFFKTLYIPKTLYQNVTLKFRYTEIFHFGGLTEMETEMKLTTYGP